MPMKKSIRPVRKYRSMPRASVRIVCPGVRYRTKKKIPESEGERLSGEQHHDDGRQDHRRNAFSLRIPAAIRREGRQAGHPDPDHHVVLRKKAGHRNRVPIVAAHHAREEQPCVEGGPGGGSAVHRNQHTEKMPDARARQKVSQIQRFKKMRQPIARRAVQHLRDQPKSHARGKQRNRLNERL